MNNINSYRKHYLEHLRKKNLQRKKKHKKEYFKNIFRKNLKYIFIFLFFVLTFPLLYTSSQKSGKIFVEWLNNTSEMSQNLKSPVPSNQNEEIYPEIRVVSGSKTNTYFKQTLSQSNFFHSDKSYSNKDNVDIDIFDSETPFLLEISDQKYRPLPSDFPIAEAAEATNSSSSPSLLSIENSEFENSFVLFEEIGDLVDENNQNLVFTQTHPYQKSDLKKKVTQYKKHKIRPGESLWGIAKKYQISIDSIITLNKIKIPHLLRPQTIIKIPPLSGVYYKIRKNDSLLSIAKKYNISLEEIKEYNEIDSFLQPGDSLFLYQAEIPQTEKDLLFGNIFMIPVSGILTSKYGIRIHPIKKKKIFHTGIDIGYNHLSKIKASASGTVIKAGYYGSYGNFVVIKHKNGYETTYAHLNKIWVKKGQKVKKRQFIGLVGSTGLSTGPHLHFEVKHNGKFVNPLRFIKLQNKNKHRF